MFLYIKPYLESTGAIMYHLQHIRAPTLEYLPRSSICLWRVLRPLEVQIIYFQCGMGQKSRWYTECRGEGGEIILNIHHR